MPFGSTSSSEQRAQVQYRRSNGNRSRRKKKKTKRKHLTSSTGTLISIIYSKSVEYEDMDDRRAPDACIMEPNLEPSLAKVIADGNNIVGEVDNMLANNLLIFGYPK